MLFTDIVDNERTDKNTTHSYLPTYQGLFEKRAESARQVMEVGVEKGGSIKLWNDFFTNAIIHGVDIETNEDTIDFLRDLPRVELHLGKNAYEEDFVRETFENKELKFDIIVDDGSHRSDHMIFFLQNYLKLLLPGGICIVEDVRIEWIKLLYDNTPEEYRDFCYFCDLRKNKDRGDDIMFIVDLSREADSAVDVVKYNNL